MHYTLKRHLLQAVQQNENPNGLSGPLLKKGIDFECDDAEIRSAALELSEEGALWFKAFDAGISDPLAFVVRPGSKFSPRLQNTQKISFLALEILEYLYIRSSNGHEATPFERLFEVFPGNDEHRLFQAVKLLKSKSLLGTRTEIPGHPGALWILPGGISLVEKTPLDQHGKEIIMGDKINIQDSSNINFALKSPGANQSISNSSTQPTAEQIQQAIQSALTVLPSLELPSHIEKKVKNALEAAADSAEEEEQDLEHSLQSVNRALKITNAFTEQMARLAAALGPVAIFLGEQSVKYC